MKIVLPVKDYAALKKITHQAAYRQIKQKKISSEPVIVQRKEIGVVIDTNELNPQELEQLQYLLKAQN